MIWSMNLGGTLCSHLWIPTFIHLVVLDVKSRDLPLTLAHCVENEGASTKIVGIIMSQCSNNNDLNIK